LDPLAKLSNLTRLTFELTSSRLSNLASSRVSNLEPLAKLDNLTQLTLNLRLSQVSNLEPLTKLTRLQELSIPSATRAQRMSLQKIPAGLNSLRF
jgi:Leucine-rich repeat (LRR) protein